MCVVSLLLIWLKLEELHGGCRYLFILSRERCLAIENEVKRIPEGFTFGYIPFAPYLPPALMETSDHVVCFIRYIAKFLKLPDIQFARSFYNISCRSF
jgi:hypothetical protein